MHRFLRLTLPAVAMLSVAVPLAACGGDDDSPDTPVTTVAPDATSNPGSMTDPTMEDGSTDTTLGTDNNPVEGDTGNGTGSSAP
jgi:hypothetical protein